MTIGFLVFFWSSSFTPIPAQAVLKIKDQMVSSGEAVLHVKIVGKGKPVLLVPGFASGAFDY